VPTAPSCYDEKVAATKFEACSYSGSKGCANATNLIHLGVLIFGSSIFHM